MNYVDLEMHSKHLIGPHNPNYLRRQPLEYMAEASCLTTLESSDLGLIVLVAQISRNVERKTDEGTSISQCR